MKMTVLLLLSAVALLAGVAVASPVPDHTQANLDRILDLVQNNSRPEDVLTSFVEDVDHLAQGTNKCEQKFFCKVEEILEQHKHFSAKETELVQTLKQNNKDVYNLSCQHNKTEEQSTSTSTEFQIRKLLTHLTNCIQHINFHKKSPASR